MSGYIKHKPKGWSEFGRLGYCAYMPPLNGSCFSVLGEQCEAVVRDDGAFTKNGKGSRKEG